MQKRNGQTIAHRPNPAQCLFVTIKFYWNPATCVHLRIVYRCFHAMTAELSSWDRDHLACKPKILLSEPLEKMFGASDLECSFL